MTCGFAIFRVTVLGNSRCANANIVEPYCLDLPNLERINDGVARLVGRVLPFVRNRRSTAPPHAANLALTKGMIDPDTECSWQEAFWRDLNPRCRRSGKARCRSLDRAVFVRAQ